MKSWMKVLVGITTLGVFVGLFLLARGISVMVARSKPQVKASPPIVQRGNYGRYLYGISSLTSEHKKVAQFDPALPADDGVVLEALRSLAKDGLGLTIGDDVSLAVETIEETNFVTFTVGKTKVLFELFRNSSGQVGTVHFWQQQLLP